jgi:hypothetical protein
VRAGAQRLVIIALLTGGGLPIQANSGIFTCVDGNGRKLTSDRPIPECTDREQMELNPSGTLRRKIGPALTAPELAAQEAKDRQLAEEQARIREEKRRDHALLTRYPSRSMHDSERHEALVQIDEVIKTAQKRMSDLREQRQKIDAEMEFYKKDPNKAPARLKRQVDENNQTTTGQQRFIGGQEEEKKRVNARFDAELSKLEKLWAAVNSPPSLATPSAARPASR